MSKFPYGELLSRAPSAFDPPRHRMCVTHEQLVKILRRRTRLRLKWRCRTYSSGMTGAAEATRKFGHRTLMIKVLLCKATGWWYVRLFTSEEPWSSECCDLSFALTPRQALFPSIYTACLAAELFASGQNWEVAPLVWQDEDGEWFVPGKRQSTCAAA
jgi:hypothetical protein